MDEREAAKNSDGSKLEQIASTSTINSKEIAIAEPEVVNKSLYLADLGFGKRIYNPKAMDGLAAFLKYNKIGKEIDSVFIEGGLIPMVPRHSGRIKNLNLTMLANLATKKGKTEKEFYEMMSSFEQVFDDEKKEDRKKIKRDMKRYHNLVKQKIVNRAESSEFAKNELSKLVGVLSNNVIVHYQIDEEERENITEDVAVMISNLEMQGKELKKNRDKLKKLIKEKMPMAAFNPVLSLEKKVLGYVKRSLNSLKKPNIKNNELQEYYNKLLDGKVCSKFFTEFSKDEVDLIKGHVLDQTTKKQLERTYENLEKRVVSNIKDIREFEAEKKEIEDNINAIKAILGSYGFYKVTKRGFTDAAIVETVYGIVKEKSNEYDYDASPNRWKNKNKDNFHVHSSVEKILQIKNKKDGQDTIYNPKIVKVSKDGIKILMNYNVNSMNSRVPTKRDIRLQMDDAHFRNKNNMPVPDIYLSGNGVGGFRVILEQKYSENTIEGEERKTPEMLIHIKLPNFHYLENLDYTKSKGIKTNDTKRFFKKLDGGGAVIHTIKSNNVHELEMATVDELIKCADIESEIKSKIDFLNKNNLSRDKSKQVRNEIKELKKEMVLDLKKIEVSGDGHIGCTNYPGRPSNYDVEIASQNYQKKNGLPDMLVGSEYLNGSKKKSFDSDKQNMSKDPVAFSINLEKIANDSSLSMNEKIKKILKYAITDKNRTALPRISQQGIVMKELVIPYFEEILKKDGKGRILFVSGNHPNEDTNYDEAEVVASLIPDSPKYIENHQLELGKGAGESYGLKTIRIDGDKTLFASHKPKNGPDVIIGAMQQLLDANVNADIAVFFDRHHPGGGFADGTFYIAAAGKQPWNEYVTKIGQTPGLRGIVNFFHDPNKKGYGKLEFVLDPALEREEYMQKI